MWSNGSTTGINVNNANNANADIHPRNYDKDTVRPKQWHCQKGVAKP